MLHDQIEFKLPKSLEWTKATITGRTRKASGKYKMWYNIEDEVTEDQKSVDLHNIEWRKIWKVNSVVLDKRKVENDTYEAKQLELKKLLQFDTHEEVKDEEQKSILTCLAITNKGGVRAHLVARGFEEKSFIPKDSPTVLKGSMRVFLAVASSKNWKIKTTDVKSVGLHGNELEREVFIAPPVESDTPEGYIWKLKHGLYELKDGALSVLCECEGWTFETQIQTIKIRSSCVHSCL